MKHEERKKIKSKARQVLKKHYLLLVLICLIASFLGTEFNSVTNAIKINENEGADLSRTFAEQVSEAAPGGFNGNMINVLQDIAESKYEEGEKKADEAASEYASQTSGLLSRSSGFLASGINEIESGRLFIKIAQGLRNAFHSDTAGTVVFIVLSIIIYALVWIFLRNVFSVILRRAFLQSQNYDKVQVSSVGFLRSVRRWTRASLTMLLKYVYYTLWSLTVVGGIIKYFSYFLVPYIVAENPDIKPNRAITLSRRMMNGHKFECFLLILTFIGWKLLGALTFGVLDILYVIPYQVGTFTGYYVKLREEAKAKNIEDAELLNDKYLYERAPAELLNEKYPEYAEYAEYYEKHRIKLSKVKYFFVKWFGIWVGTMEEKREFQKKMSARYRMQESKSVIEGTLYPLRLHPLWNKRIDDKYKENDVYFIRGYTVWSLIFMFFLFAFIGWLWEVSLYYIQMGEFVNRGTLLGPWLPIYGFGGVIALVFCARFRNKPALTLLVSVILCGCIEYFSSWMLEAKYGLKWWDYSGNFLNLNGRICAEGLIAFGIGCMLAVYIVGPALDRLVSKAKVYVVAPIAVALLILIGIDYANSVGHPNTGKGITDGESATETVPAGETTASLEVA